MQIILIAMSDFDFILESECQSSILNAIEARDRSKVTIAQVTWMSVNARDYKFVTYQGHWLFNTGAKAKESFKTTQLREC